MRNFDLNSLEVPICFIYASCILYTYTCIHIYMHTHIHAYIYLHIYIHSHTIVVNNIDSIITYYQNQQPKNITNRIKIGKQTNKTNELKPT